MPMVLSVPEIARWRWLPALATLSAVVLLAWNAAGLTWRLSGSRPEPGSLPDSARAEPVATLNLGALLAAELFGKGPPVPMPGGTGFEQLPLSSLGIVLNGILALGDAGFALVSVNGQPQEPFSVGQEITGGAILRKLHRDRIIIERQGAFEAVLLDGANSSSEPHGLFVAPAEPAATGNTGAGQNYTLARAVIDKHLRDPQAFQNSGQIVPNPGGGFMVRQIQPNSLYAQYGLRQGDVIRSVNGTPLNTPSDVMQAYQQFSNQPNIQIDIVRGGRPETLNYSLR